MSTIATLLLNGLALYAVLGLGIGLAFVVAGITRILPRPVPVTIPARILLFPGAAVLWPVVLRKWLQAIRSDPQP